MGKQVYVVVGMYRQRKTRALVPMLPQVFEDAALASQTARQLADMRKLNGQPFYLNVTSFAAEVDENRYSPSYYDDGRAG